MQNVFFKLCKVIVSCLLKQKRFGRARLFVSVKKLTIPLPQHGERKRESESDQGSTWDQTRPAHAPVKGGEMNFSVADCWEKILLTWCVNSAV